MTAEQDAARSLRRLPLGRVTQSDGVFKRVARKHFGPIVFRHYVSAAIKQAQHCEALVSLVGPSKLHIVRALTNGAPYLDISRLTPRNFAVSDDVFATEMYRLSEAAKHCRLLLVGRRDRLKMGLDLDSFFESVVRFEVGMLPNRFTGSNKPSIGYVVDRRGPYYDGEVETDLEATLNSLERGWWHGDEEVVNFLREYRASSLTKYMIEGAGDEEVPDENDVLVLGQCTGDQALLYTVGETRSNVDMVRRVVEEEPSGASIYYRPHPKNLTNEVELEEIKRSLGDRVVLANPRFPFVDLLRNRPAVRTITSGAGLEAAVRGCRTKCYAVSFYSNWGFTEDATVCSRRTNSLSVEDVFLYVYTKYSRYLHPFEDGEISPLEALRGVLSRS